MTDTVDRSASSAFARLSRSALMANEAMQGWAAAVSACPECGHPYEEGPDPGPRPASSAHRIVIDEEEVTKNVRLEPPPADGEVW